MFATTILQNPVLSVCSHSVSLHVMRCSFKGVVMAGEVTGGGDGMR